MCVFLHSLNVIHFFFNPNHTKGAWKGPHIRNATIPDGICQLPNENLHNPIQGSSTLITLECKTFCLALKNSRIIHFLKTMLRSNLLELLAAVFTFPPFCNLSFSSTHLSLAITLPFCNAFSKMKSQIVGYILKITLMHNMWCFEIWYAQEILKIEGEFTFLSS